MKPQRQKPLLKTNQRWGHEVYWDRKGGGENVHQQRGWGRLALSPTSSFFIDLVETFVLKTTLCTEKMDNLIPDHLRCLAYQGLGLEGRSQLYVSQVPGSQEEGDCPFIPGAPGILESRRGVLC